MEYISCSLYPSASTVCPKSITGSYIARASIEQQLSFQRMNEPYRETITSTTSWEDKKRAFRIVIPCYHKITKQCLSFRSETSNAIHIKQFTICSLIYASYICILQTAYDLADNTFFSFLFLFPFYVCFHFHFAEMTQSSTRNNVHAHVIINIEKKKKKDHEWHGVDTRASVRASGVANECTHTYMTYIWQIYTIYIYIYIYMFN